MAITKRLRFVFYALVTLEVLLLSGYYSWGRTGRQNQQTTTLDVSDTVSYDMR